MKKLLALVLALVMTLGLATVGANAAYADADSINYKEAVDVMTAIGVLAGDETGFRPADTLKRSEGAKIIAYLLLGNKAAEAMQGTGTKFTDLPANHWAAGYMEYLASQGVMGGVGDGKIDPDGQLTATMFAKMLLCALGYDQQIEGFVGADWSINTQKIANQVGIFDGNSDVVGSAVVTREEAALYVFNTICSPLVTYANKGSKVSVNGAEISFGASSAEYMTTTSDAKTQTISQAKVNNNQGNYIVEFAEQYYPQLALDATERDAFGRPAHYWRLNHTDIGTYAIAPDLTYTESVKSGKLYSDLNIGTVAANDADIYVDGEDTEQTSATGTQTNLNSSGATAVYYNTFTIAKSGTASIGGNGVLVEVYDTTVAGGNPSVDIVIINTYVGQVTAVKAATSTTKRTVTISQLTPAGKRAHTYNGSGTYDMTFESETLNKDDIVAYTLASSQAATPKYTVQSAKVLTAAATSQSVTAYTASNAANSTASFTAGETYKYSAKYSVDDGLKEISDLGIGATVDVYTDAYGYAIYVTGSQVAKDYAVVIGRGATNQYGTGATGATLLLADGTTKNVTFKMATGDTMSTKQTFGNIDFVGDLVTYTVGTDGVYTLTLATDGTNKTGAYAPDGNGYSGTIIGGVDQQDAEFTSGKSLLTIDAGARYLYTTSDTLFFVRTGAVNDSTKWSYKIYTGYANAPTFDLQDAGGITFAVNSKNQVEAVFVATATAKGAGVSGTYISKPASVTVTTNKTGNKVPYVTLPAVVNGEITTLNIAYTTGNGNFFDDGNQAGEFVAMQIDYMYVDGYETDTYGIVTAVDELQAQPQDPADTVNEYFEANGTIGPNGEVVGFGLSAATAQYWAYNSKTEVYVIASDGKSIEKGSITDIYTDPNDIVTYVVDQNTKVVERIFVRRGTTVALVGGANYATLTADINTALANNAVTDIVVDGQLTITGATITVPAGKTLTVTGALVDNNQKLTVNAGGKVVVKGDGVTDVAFTAKPAISGELVIEEATANTTFGADLDVQETGVVTTSGNVVWTLASDHNMEGTMTVGGTLTVDQNHTLTVGDGTHAASLSVENDETTFSNTAKLAVAKLGVVTIKALDDVALIDDGTITSNKGKIVYKDAFSVNDEALQLAGGDATDCGLWVFEEDFTAASDTNAVTVKEYANVIFKEDVNLGGNNMFIPESKTTGHMYILFVKATTAPGNAFLASGGGAMSASDPIAAGTGFTNTGSAQTWTAEATATLSAD